jgi:hypothetical protein
MNRHPAQTRLALYAGGDMDFAERLAVALHLAGCGRCRDEAQAFRRTSAEVKEAAMEMPPGLDWDTLSGEMKANIRLGLAAGAAVEPVFRDARPEPLSWRAALVLGAATAVVVLGWFLNLPQPQADLALAGGVVLEATEAGVELKEGGSAMVLTHPGSAAVFTAVSARGSVRAHYVDAETGQVTVTNVYAE